MGRTKSKILIFNQFYQRNISLTTKMADLNLKDHRTAYKDRSAGLNDEVVSKWNCPYEVFAEWMSDASKKVDEYNAMTIASVNKQGFPSARMVLLKEVKADQGFIFFTNYGSRKAQEIDANPNVALVFYWSALNRSVRIEGKAERIPASESEDYFRSRPKASQIGSAVSPQSQLVKSRDWLWDRNDEMFKQDEIEMPNWGGYLVTPHWIEFWQGQSNRLHDRVVFTQGQFDREKDFTENEDFIISTTSSGWQRARLAP